MIKRKQKEINRKKKNKDKKKKYPLIRLKGKKTGGKKRGKK